VADLARPRDVDAGWTRSYPADMVPSLEASPIEAMRTA
jgi:hypothetical protein